MTPGTGERSFVLSAIIATAPGVTGLPPLPVPISPVHEEIILSGDANRRQFLKTAALATGGAGLQLVTAQESDAQQSRRGQGPLRADVCVVGAGYAGLTAALRLQQAGRSVVVIEARDRVGGRIWSDLLSDGTAIDIGGHWVGPQQLAILRLAREMQVATFPSYDVGDTLFVKKDGTVGLFNDLLVTNPLALIELQSTFDELDRLAKDVPTEAPWQSPHAADWDAQTVASWIAANVDDPPARRPGQRIARSSPRPIAIRERSFDPRRSPARAARRGGPRSEANPRAIDPPARPPAGSFSSAAPPKPGAPSSGQAQYRR